MRTVSFACNFIWPSCKSTWFPLITLHHVNTKDAKQQGQLKRRGTQERPVGSHHSRAVLVTCLLCVCCAQVTFCKAIGSRGNYSVYQNGISFVLFVLSKTTRKWLFCNFRVSMQWLNCCTSIDVWDWQQTRQYKLNFPQRAHSNWWLNIFWQYKLNFPQRAHSNLVYEYFKFDAHETLMQWLNEFFVSKHSFKVRSFPKVWHDVKRSL